MPESDLTEAQRRELDRRVALVDEGKTVMSPWEEVEARILARLDPEDVAQVADEEEPLTDDQKQVFQRRIADLWANPSIGLTWEQIEQHIKGTK